MLQCRLIIATATAALVATVPVFGELPARVRGTITKLHDHSFTIKERDGRSFNLTDGPYTSFADVVPSRLDSIRVNDYIGTATKGPPDNWIAVEIVLVPESMRAGRKGVYAWDPLPDTSGVEAVGSSAKRTTRSIESAIQPPMPALTNTTMTNGIVTANEAGPAGRFLTVGLVDGKTARIAVSYLAPIVRFIQSDRRAIRQGSHVVVWTKQGSVATLVAVGKGVTPPM